MTEPSLKYLVRSVSLAMGGSDMTAPSPYNAAQSKVACTNRGNQQGVSMIELLIVTAIASVMAATSVPVVLRNLHTYQLNAASTEMYSIIGQARYAALTANTPISLRQTTETVSGRTVFYVDLNGDGVWQNTEPGWILPLEVSFPTSGYPAISTTGYATTTSLTASGSTALQFDNRGVPTFTSVYTIVIGSTSQADEYRCLTINAMGKVKIWRSSGTNWVNP